MNRLNFFSLNCSHSQIETVDGILSPHIHLISPSLFCLKTATNLSAHGACFCFDFEMSSQTKVTQQIEVKIIFYFIKFFFKNWNFFINILHLFAVFYFKIFKNTNENCIIVSWSKARLNPRFVIEIAQSTPTSSAAAAVAALLALCKLTLSAHTLSSPLSLLSLLCLSAEQQKRR